MTFGLGPGFLDEDQPDLVFSDEGRTVTKQGGNPASWTVVKIKDPIAWNEDLNSNGYVVVFSLPDPLANNTAVFTVTTGVGTSTINKVGHNLSNGDVIKVSSSGTLPSPLSDGLTDSYFVRNKTNDTFQVSTSAAGAIIDFTDSGTGTHTYTFDVVAVGFRKPSSSNGFLSAGDAHSVGVTNLGNKFQSNGFAAITSWQGAIDAPDDIIFRVQNSSNYSSTNYTRNDVQTILDFRTTSSTIETVGEIGDGVYEPFIAIRGNGNKVSISTTAQSIGYYDDQPGTAGYGPEWWGGFHPYHFEFPLDQETVEEEINPVNFVDDPYREEVLIDLPQLYWPLNEGPSSDPSDYQDKAHDESGHFYEAEYTSAADHSGTRLRNGPYYAMDGSATLAIATGTAPTYLYLNPPSTDLTIEFMFKCADLAGAPLKLISSSSAIEEVGALSVYVYGYQDSTPGPEVNILSSYNSNNDGKLIAIFTKSTGGTEFIMSSLVMDDSINRHIAITKTATQFKMYINGVLHKTKSCSSFVMNDADWETFYINGRLSDLAIYHTALGAARITAHNAAIVPYDGTKVFATYYNHEQIQERNRQFYTNHNVAGIGNTERTFGTSYKLTYVDLVSGARSFGTRYKHSRTSDNTYSFNTKYNLGLIGDTVHSFRTPYAVQLEDITRVHSFSVPYKHDRLDTVIKAFKTLYKNASGGSIKQFGIPYYTRPVSTDLSSASVFVGTGPVNHEITLDKAEIPVPEFLIIIDNGGKFNKYIVETIINEDLTSDAVDITYTATDCIVTIKNIENVADGTTHYYSAVSVTFCNPDFSEWDFFVPTEIYPPGPTLMIQSSDIFKTFLKKPITCCFTKKIDFDKEALCAIPVKNKVELDIITTTNTNLGLSADTTLYTVDSTSLTVDGA